MTNDYDLLEEQIAALLADETDFIANAANASAALYHGLSDVNWVGFYFADREGLVLGPFQGRPACTRLPRGRGVCGAALTRGQTVIVDDVAAFAGHIVCDPASQSEIALPLCRDGSAIGVLDLDSPLKGRFTLRDAAALERIAARFLSATSFP